MSNDTAAKINAAVESHVRTFVEELTELVKVAIRDLVAEAAGKIDVRAGAAPARSGAARKVAPRAAAAATAAIRGKQAERKRAAGKAPPRLPPGAPTAAGSKGAKKLPTTAGGKRTAAEMRRAEEAVLSWVRANPGQRVEPMAAALGVKTKDITRPLAKLAKAGLIRREGKKRATKYFPAAGAAGTTKAAGTAEGARSSAAPASKTGPASKAGSAREGGKGKAKGRKPKAKAK